MPGLTVVAQVEAKKEFVERVRGELQKLVAPTREEQGCIEYRLHQDCDNPAVFIFYENWKNADCLDRHMNSDHFRAYLGAVEGLIQEKVVHKMAEIEQA